MYSFLCTIPASFSPLLGATLYLFMNIFLYSSILSTGVLLCHLALVIFFLLYLSPLSSFKRAAGSIVRRLIEYGHVCALGVALISTVAPLIYSELYHLTPCTLCWYQRIFMFPLLLILLVSYLRKEWFIKPYVYVLAGIGLCISIYHIISQQLLEHFNIDTSGCDAIGMTTKCSLYYFMEYGYITIPVMTATSFILILFFIHFSKKQ